MSRGSNIDPRVAENLSDVFGQRVAAARERLGMTREALASYMGYAEDSSMVTQIEAYGKLPSASKLLKLMEVLGVSAEWLLGVEGVPMEGDEASYPHDPAFVSVASETVGAGYPGADIEIKEVDAVYPFRASRLREEGINPAQARVFQVVGDSMYPVLPDGSTILVDYKRKRPTSNAIFVFRSNGALLVKRAVHWTDGAWWWHSELPSWTARQVKSDDEVLGEVRWVGHGLNYGIACGP